MFFLCRLAPLLIYLVVLICFDPSALLSGQIVCAEEPSPSQPAVLQTRPELARLPDAHSEILPISNGPLSGKQYVWRSATQTGSSLAEPALKHRSATCSTHQVTGPHQRSCFPEEGHTYIYPQKPVCACECVCACVYFLHPTVARWAEKLLTHRLLRQVATG